MKNHLIQSIKDAPDNKVIKEVLIEGMTSDLVRGLLNNLVSASFVSYLEIGVWQGATFISALYNNRPAYALGIDNFSEFGCPRQQFADNCKLYLDQPFNFIDQDCFTVDRAVIPLPINVYFYDGNHSKQSQYKALEYYLDVLDKSFILLIDDWNWEDTRLGTQEAIKSLNLTVDYEVHLPASFNGDTKQWWNGLYAVVLMK